MNESVQIKNLKHQLRRANGIIDDQDRQLDLKDAALRIMEETGRITIDEAMTLAADRVGEGQSS